MKYPIFAQDMDKWMYMIKKESDLNSYFEVIDVENNEYSGWDKTGIPIVFYLDRGKIKVKSLSETPQLEKLKRAIFDYAEIASPKVPFEYSDMKDNVTELFEAIEMHIKSEGIIGKIKRYWKTGRKS